MNVQEVKNMLVEMKNVFHGLISILDTAKKRVSELEEKATDHTN